VISDLASLTSLGQAALWAGFVVFLRVGGMLALVPAFGEQSIPLRVRLGLVIGFSLIVLPAVAGTIPAADTPLGVLRIAGAEVLTGLIFGMLLRLFVLALQMAGAIASLSTSLSQIFGGSAGIDAQPAIGHLLVIAGLALAALLGLHVRLAAYMIESYALVPPGIMISPTVVAEAGLHEVSRSFELAFTLSAPFVVASLIYNVTLGVINRAMPQLMVAFVGAPAITAGGLGLLLISAPLLLSIWADDLGAFMSNPFGTVP
jgi:flagellar biosynthetic protein FliR